MEGSNFDRIVLRIKQGVNENWNGIGQPTPKSSSPIKHRLLIDRTIIE